MGGLATALALAKEDFRSIDVCEPATGLGSADAGIHLAPTWRVFSTAWASGRRSERRVWWQMPQVSGVCSPHAHVFH